MLNHRIEILRTLGPRWVLFRLRHAVRLKGGYFRRRLPATSWKEVRLSGLLSDTALSDPAAYLARRRERPPCFAPATEAEDRVAEADAVLEGRFLLYGYHEAERGFPPDWHTNAFTGETAPSGEHWSTIDLFAFGDVKNTWELSRFGFAYPLVQAYQATGKERYAEAFWRLFEDWRAHNPPNLGINWACGQETSLRLMAWCYALEGFLHAEATTPELVVQLAEAIAFSALRVEVNIDYALAQENNHGFSEAAGLWTAGTLFPEFEAARGWVERGRRELLGLADRLVYVDGVFCHFSNNYQRAVLQTLTWVLALSRAQGIAWPETFRSTVETMARYLHTVMEPATGEGPLTGANDGSLVLPLAGAAYSDMRPALQSGFAAATGNRLLDKGPWDREGQILGLLPGGPARPPVQEHVAVFPEGGFYVLRGRRSRALVRAASRFRHRPFHGDQLHVDLWVSGVNVLPDGGTYSYNDPDWTDYFRSVRAHNTVQFDGRDQMTPLGRFLYGHWLTADAELLGEDEDAIAWRGTTRDRHGAYHQRTVRLKPASDQWVVEDRLAGFRKEAVLRWRLNPDVAWTFHATGCRSSLLDIQIEGGHASREDGWISRHYMAKEALPVLVVRVAEVQEATLVTRFSMHA